jgi:hypothetical protein
MNGRAIKTALWLGGLLLVISGAMGLLGSVRADAQSTNSYTLSWWTIDGGGTTSAAGNDYTLGSTAGQPDAAVWSGGDYVLAGGFWGGTVVEYHIYLPLVLRG